MNTPPPLKLVSWTLATLLALLLLIVVFLLTFDWNHARPYINRKVSAATGREFAIDGDLALHLVRDHSGASGWRRFVPQLQVSADRVRIGNPDWSTVGPRLAEAGRIVVTVRPLPLFDRHVVLTGLTLAAPQLALQRRADGSNTWTFKDNGPSTWQFDVQRLSFSDGSVHYRDDGIALDLLAKATSLAAPATAATATATATTPTPATPAAPATAATPAYGMQFTLGGSYRKAPISGGGKAGAVLALRDADAVYPVEAKASIGQNRIAIAGTLTEPTAPQGMTLRLSLAGASMAELYPLTGVLLPETPPYAIHGRLIGKHGGASWDWTYQDFSGTVGGSDLAGTLEYLPRQPRALLRGAVTSQQLRLADLGPSIGAGTDDAQPARDHGPAQPAGKALPVAPFDTAHWGALDADVKFTGKRLVRTHDIPLDNVVADIHLKNKVLSLTPLNFGFAGGAIASDIALDGRQSAIAAHLEVAARHLKVRELFPKLQSMQASFGEVNGDAALSGHGNSVAAMLATANGEAGAVVSNGSVSHFILEAAGLNVANAVFVKLFGDQQIKLNCMVSDFAVTNGRADTRRFVLDTDNAVVDINGDVDLAREQLNLDIRPQTKGARIFSLRTPLYAKGTFEHPDVGPYKGPLALKAGAAVALAAAVTPLAAALPLVNLGRVPDTDCAAAIAQAEQTRSAPKAPAPTATTRAQLGQGRTKAR
ncbi:AsmA family protein [Rugamonas sp.]|uniref:AsmA family protein n=1 Tax=Rugamonas sp. TaxID=1926287 RepID=UPI0025FDC9AE|nr:AsmA family protein [Rugamonas sp.]